MSYLRVLGFHVSTPRVAFMTCQGKPACVHLHRHCHAESWRPCLPSPMAAGASLGVCVTAEAWQGHGCSAGRFQGDGCSPAALDISPVAWTKTQSIQVLSSISY